MNERISSDTGSGCTVFVCNVDGWQCAAKVLSLEGIPASQVQKFESEGLFFCLFFCVMLMCGSIYKGELMIYFLFIYFFFSLSLSLSPNSVFTRKPSSAQKSCSISFPSTK